MKNVLVASLLSAVIAAPIASFASETVKPVDAVKTETTTTATTVKTEVKAEVKKAQLKDGTNIEIRGEEVFVIGKDGKAALAPDATHTLSDGSSVTTKGGKVVKQ